MNLLIDEMLSPTLVPLLADKGVPAQHVVHTGMEAATDSEVWAFAFDHDEAVVTVNASHYLHLATTAALHPGLIVLRSHGLSRQEQWQWLEPVVDWLLESGAALVNRVVEVTGIGKFACRDLPSP